MGIFLFSLQDVLNNLGSSELDEDDLMLDMDLSDDQRHRHGNFSLLLSVIQEALHPPSGLNLHLTLFVDPHQFEL